MNKRVVIITGGCGGIGRHVAQGLISIGFKVILVGRNEMTYRDVFGDQIRSPLVEFHKVDIASIEKVSNFYEQINNADLAIWGLINAAGIQSPIGIFDEADPQDWANNISVNLLGSANMMRGAIKIFKSSGRGKIINFSGGGATSSRPNFSAYAVSKTAIVRLTEVIAEELSEYNIDVNAVAPGVINTGMLQEILQAGATAGKEEEAAIQRKHSGGDPIENIVDLCKFLISDDSSGISGKLISAVWDDYRNDKYLIRIRKDADFCSLRRIDEKNFDCTK